jgi:ABC-type cobalamin transport system ATPase subunit
VANAASRDASIRAVAFTSALSPALEELLLRGRTSFVIAHRLSTIRHADQVLALKDGQIIERGTHEELLAARGFYYDLYMSQFRRDIDFAEEVATPASVAAGR